MTAVPNILLESQQNALLTLLAGLEVAAEPLRPGLLQSFVEEFARHVASLEIGVFPAAERLSLGTKVRLTALRAEHAQMLQEVGARLRRGPLEVAAVRSTLLEHFERERALLQPLLSRLTSLHEAVCCEVDRNLLVTHWSPALERATGRTAEQMLGRPLSGPAGSPALHLALPTRTGVMVWYPAWTEHLLIPSAADLKDLMREPYPENLRRAAESGLEALRGQLGASCAQLYLLDPVERANSWLAFQAGQGETDRLGLEVARTGEAGRQDRRLFVPLVGLDGPLGALGMAWTKPEPAPDSASTVLLWAAQPLTLALEPLVDSLRHPGQSWLSPGPCAQALRPKGQ